MKITEEAIQAEKVLLASMLNYSNQFVRYGGELHPAIWNVAEHQILFQLMRQQYVDHGQIDLLGLRHMLTEKKIDLSLINDLPQGISQQSLDIYLNIIRETYQRRAYAQLAQELANTVIADNSDTGQLYELVQQTLKQQSEVLSYNKTKRIGDIISEAIHQKLRSGTIEWFSQKLQSVVGHIKNGELSVIGGRPGMGTQALCINQALYTALHHNIPVLYISLKTPAWQLVLEMAALRMDREVSGITQDDLTDTSTQTNEVIKELNNAPLHIVDDPTLHVYDLIQLMRYHFTNNQVKLFVIDDIQSLFLPTQYKSRDRELTIICHALKTLAKELNVPILCTSQVARYAEKRGGSITPILSDLRDSGSIEEVAATVLMLCRPAYYGRMEFEDGTSTHTALEVNVAKNSDGEQKTIRLLYLPSCRYVGDEFTDPGYQVPPSRQHEFDE